MSYNGVSVLFDFDDDDNTLSYVTPYIAEQLEAETEFMHNSIFFALSNIYKLVGEERFYSYVSVCNPKTISIYNVWLISTSKREQNMNCDELMSQYQETRQDLGLSKDYGILHPVLLEDIKNSSGVERRAAINRLNFYVKKTNWEDADLEPHIVDMLSLINCFLADKQRTIQLEGLDILKTLADRIGICLGPHLHQIIKGFHKLLLSINPHVKKRASNLLHKLKVNVHPMTVTLVMLSAMKNSGNFFLKEEVLYQLVSTMNYFPYYDFDLPILCQVVGQYLHEKADNVRRAAENCFSHLIQVMDDSPVEGLRGKAVYALISSGLLKENIVDALDIRLPLGGLSPDSWSSTNTPSSESSGRRKQRAVSDVKFVNNDAQLESELEHPLNLGFIHEIEPISQVSSISEIRPVEKVQRKKWAEAKVIYPESNEAMNSSMETTDGCVNQCATSSSRHITEEEELTSSMQSKVRPCSQGTIFRQKLKCRKNWNHSPSTPNLCRIETSYQYQDLESNISDAEFEPHSVITLHKECPRKCGLNVPVNIAYDTSCTEEYESTFIEQEKTSISPDEAGDREAVGRHEVSSENNSLALDDSKNHQTSGPEMEVLDPNDYNFNIMQVDDRVTEETSGDDDAEKNPCEIVHPTWVEEPEDEIQEEIESEEFVEPIKAIDKQNFVSSSNSSIPEDESISQLKPDEEDASEIEDDSLTVQSRCSTGDRSVASECSISEADRTNYVIEDENESIPDESPELEEDANKSFIDHSDEILDEPDPHRSENIKTIPKKNDSKTPVKKKIFHDHRPSVKKHPGKGTMSNVVHNAKPCVSEGFEVHQLNDVQNFYQKYDPVRCPNDIITSAETVPSKLSRSHKHKAMDEEYSKDNFDISNDSLETSVHSKDDKVDGKEINDKSKKTSSKTCSKVQKEVKNFVEINSRKSFVRRVDPKPKSVTPTAMDPKTIEARKKWSSSTQKKTLAKVAKNTDDSVVRLGAMTPQTKRDVRMTSGRLNTPKRTENRKLSPSSSEEVCTPESKKASNQWKRELEYPMKGGNCPWVKSFEAEIRKLEPFGSAETVDTEVKKALEDLSGTDWAQKEEAMLTVMRIFKYHQDVARENMHKIILALGTEMKSLRQTVAGKAILTVGYMYTMLGKDLENKLRIVIDALLNRSGNRTLASGYRLVLKTLFNIVKVSTPFKAALAFAAEGTRHANKASRETAAQFLATLIETLGPIKSLHQNMAPSLLRCATVFALDGSPLTRHCGKLMFHVMMQNPNFDTLKNKHIEPSNVRNLAKILETVKSKGVSREKLPINITNLEEI